jgi:hypothetical protein
VGLRASVAVATTQVAVVSEVERDGKGLEHDWCAFVSKNGRSLKSVGWQKTLFSSHAIFTKNKERLISIIMHPFFPT